MPQKVKRNEFEIVVSIVMKVDAFRIHFEMDELREKIAKSKVQPMKNAQRKAKAANVSIQRKIQKIMTVAMVKKKTIFLLKLFQIKMKKKICS